jgi:hypothetical protein
MIFTRLTFGSVPSASRQATIDTSHMREPTRKDTSLHDRWLAEQLEDPKFRSAFERELDELAAGDADSVSDDRE